MELILSASQIGFPCDRNLWYRSRGVEEEVDKRTERIFAVGRMLESLVVQFLQEDGFKVEYNEKSHDDEPDFRIPIGKGYLIGRHDAIISPPGYGSRILADIKTMNQRAFTLWRRYGTLQKYPQYAQQLTVYWQGLSQNGQILDDTLAVIGFNKDNSVYAIDYFQYRPELWEGIKARCELIFSLDDPPEPEDIPHWACSYCGFKEICDAKPAVKAPEDVEEINDYEIELAAYMLSEARRLQQEARELEKEAKVILERLKDREKVRVGSFIISITPYRTTRLDSKSLREKMPEVYNAFLQEVVSYRYNVEEVAGD